MSIFYSYLLFLSREFVEISEKLLSHRPKVYLLFLPSYGNEISIPRKLSFFDNEDP